MAVAEKSDQILSACLNCWNDLDAFRAREFFFTKLGVFGFNEDDMVTIDKRLKDNQGHGKKGKASRSSNKKPKSHLQKCSNPIQWKLIQMLRPIA